MRVGPKVPPPNPVYLPYPVNVSHPILRGRVGWFNRLPGLSGGLAWPNLMGGPSAILANSSSPDATHPIPVWSNLSSPGGYGSIQFGIGASPGYITLPASPQFNLTGDLTLLFWAYWTTVAQGFIIGGYQNSGAFAGYGIRYDTTAAVYQVWDSTAWRSSNFAPVVNTPHHVGVSIKALAATWYLNGVAKNTVTTTAINGTYTGVRALGVVAGGSGTPAPVILNDIAFHNTALTAGEINAIYGLSQRGYPGVLNRYRSSMTTLGPKGASAGSHFPIGLLSNRQPLGV
jgi:hypothetical protein